MNNKSGHGPATDSKSLAWLLSLKVFFCHPIDPHAFEEVVELFEKSKKGGKNYRVVLKSLNQWKIRTINPDQAKYRERFGCNDITQEHILLAIKALLWRELPNDVLDYNLSIFFGRMKFNAQLSNFTAVSRLLKVFQQVWKLYWWNIRPC